jgi:NOL1/NOP2/fmu family ribosome biogenesis protein
VGDLMSYKLEILNTREVKELNNQLDEQHGCKFDKSLVFIKSGKEKIYVVNRDIEKVDLNSIKLDRVGLYVCTINDFGLRLTIEGSQILGINATKNIVELDDDQLNSWLRGEDIDIICSGDTDKFFIVCHKGDFCGSGKFKNGILSNFVPKERRTGASF